MPVIRSQALLKRARSAKPPKPRRDLEVIQVETTAAAGADELIHVVVAVLDTAVHDAGRLAPQHRRGAVGRAARRAGARRRGRARHAPTSHGDDEGVERKPPDGQPVRYRSRCQGRQYCSLNSPPGGSSSRHRGLEQRYCLPPDTNMPSLRSQCPAGSDPARSPRALRADGRGGSWQDRGTPRGGYGVPRAV